MCSFISDVLDLSKKTVKKTTTATVETSLKAVRSYYNLKMEVVNTCSELTPEWFFKDITTIKKYIKNTEEKYKNIMSMYQCKVEAVENSKINSSKLNVKKIEIMKRMENYKRDGYVREYERENENLRKVNAEIELINKEINKLDIEKNDLKKEVKDLCWEVVWAKSQIKETFSESKRLAEINGLQGEYVFYGLKCVECYYQGRYEESYNKAVDYYIAVNGNLNKKFHPIISYHISKYLLDIGEYLKAKEYIDFLIISFPDNIEYHMLLLYFYNMKGTEKDIKVQKEIISMLA